jgi:hypothetical protein
LKGSASKKKGFARSPQNLRLITRLARLLSRYLRLRAESVRRRPGTVASTSLRHLLFAWLIEVPTSNYPMLRSSRRGSAAAKPTI